MAFDKKQFKELIEETLKEIDMYSESAVNLLLGTAAQESHFGTYLKQINGPALGIFQMEPKTHDDIWNNYLHYKQTISDDLLFKFGYAQDCDQLVYDIKYAIIMARLQYRRRPEPLPYHQDIPALAAYWKQWYNTPDGAGTVNQFINNYQRYIGM